MSIRQSFDLFCDADDGCGQWADVTARFGSVGSRAIARDLRSAARRIGWTFRHGKDYCPKHSKRSEVSP